MPISVKQQVALGVAGTAVVATGGTLIYKNSTSKTGEQETESIVNKSEISKDQESSKLLAIEQLAIDTENWKIENPSKVINHTPEALRIVASIQRNDLDASKYGATSGSWTCEIIISSAASSDETFIKKILNSYFSGYSSDTPANPLKVEKPNREFFVNKCSNNRQGNSNKNTVTAQVTVPANTFVEDLKTVLGEFPLFQPEQEAISAPNWTITTSSSKDGSKTTFTIKVADSTESWVCSLLASATADSIDFEGVKEDLKNKLNIELNESGTHTADSIEDSNKRGFLNSCARNRKINPSSSSSKVEGELKLSLSTGGAGNTYKFIENDLEKVFKGIWINSV